MHYMPKIRKIMGSTEKLEEEVFCCLNVISPSALLFFHTLRHHGRISLCWSSGIRSPNH